MVDRYQGVAGIPHLRRGYRALVGPRDRALGTRAMYSAANNASERRPPPLPSHHSFDPTRSVVRTTRRVTGVGYPQLSAIIECADAALGLKGQVCADGGCTAPGDVAKAYGAGADFVMLGGMLAGHDECDGQIRFEERGGEKVAVGMTFYGMSSETAMRKHSGGVAHYRAAEGKTVETPYRGSVEGTMAEIMGGVRSMMTYIGAAHLKEVSKRTTFVRVTAQTNDVFGG
jgi:GMP reductase